MKKIITIILLIPLGLALHSQNSCTDILVDFESVNEYILIDSSSNLWQVGKPNKDLFSQSYSGQNSIITELEIDYEASSSTYFQIKSIKSSDLRNETYFSFYHKFDTDTLNDYGFITCSFDGGENWIMCKDTSFIYDSTCGNVEIWHYREFPGLHLNSVDPYFSGLNNEWAKEKFSFTWWLEIKKNSFDLSECSPDSILFRFNFKSDEIIDSKEGWIVDDIMVSWDHIGNVSLENSNKVVIFPNPFSTQITIENDSYEYVDIIDIFGRLLYTTDMNKNMDKILDLGWLNKGVYIVRCRTLKNSQQQILIKK